MEYLTAPQRPCAAEHRMSNDEVNGQRRCARARWRGDQKELDTIPVAGLKYRIGHGAGEVPE